MERSRIIGTGSAVPARIVSNADLEKLVDTSDEWVKSRTGISERRICGEGEDSATLAEKAAVQALEAAALDPMDLDLLLVATITPALPFPATACLLQDSLHARRAAALDISAACSGFIYGLAVADNFIRTGTYRTILLVGSETLSTITDWTDRNTCVLFADGAGAVVLQGQRGGRGILSTHLYSDGSQWDLLMAPGGGSRCPVTPEVLEQRLNMIKMSHGNEVFRIAVRAMGDACIASLKQNHLEIGDIDVLVPHQANARIMQALAHRLSLPPEKVISNIARYGNTSAASVPLALDEAVRNGKVREGNLVLLVAFGGGLTWGSAAIRW
ncbi:MAG: ketoacyl-ACP synthase III [candidate division NC10 bacterium]|nr:ketoacyl-ACP synthase III [candidate division NC10 bacterium]